MDRIQTINKIKSVMESLILDYPKTIRIHKEKDEVVFSLVYSYGQEYRKYYNEGYFSSDGKVVIKLDESIADLQGDIADLLKIKRFLVNRDTVT